MIVHVFVSPSFEASRLRRYRVRPDGRRRVGLEALRHPLGVRVRQLLRAVHQVAVRQALGRDQRSSRVAATPMQGPATGQRRLRPPARRAAAWHRRTAPPRRSGAARISMAHETLPANPADLNQHPATAAARTPPLPPARQQPRSGRSARRRAHDGARAARSADRSRSACCLGRLTAAGSASTSGTTGSARLRVQRDSARKSAVGCRWGAAGGALEDMGTHLARRPRCCAGALGRGGSAGCTPCHALRL